MQGWVLHSYPPFLIPRLLKAREAHILMNELLLTIWFIELLRIPVSLLFSFQLVTLLGWGGATADDFIDICFEFNCLLSVDVDECLNAGL